MSCLQLHWMQEQPIPEELQLAQHLEEEHPRLSRNGDQADHVAGWLPVMCRLAFAQQEELPQQPHW